MRKGFRIALGVGLVILGLIGGLLPVMQGWMFMIPGLLILSEYFPGVKRLVDWAKTKAGIKKQSPDQGPGGPSAGR
ncbi:MAG TPA: hypothetical protein VLH09_09930 [Bryobacteraceae bacterium]|nr:hypothetical protein [Bryobacteraceae bacterium]